MSFLHLHLLCACLYLKRKASQEAHRNVLMSVKRTLVFVKPGDGDRGRPGRREHGSKARWDWREKRVWSPVPSGRAMRSLPRVGEKRPLTNTPDPAPYPGLGEPGFPPQANEGRSKHCTGDCKLPGPGWPGNLERAEPAWKRDVKMPMTHCQC